MVRGSHPGAHPLLDDAGLAFRLRSSHPGSHARLDDARASALSAGAATQALTATFTTAGITTRYGVTHGGTTNLLSNGGFESNTTGWTTVASTLTLDSVGPQHFGLQHGNITTAGSAINEGAYATFTATAAPYTVSIWLNDEHGTHTMRLAVRDNAGANAQTSAPFVPPAGSWSRYTFTTTALTAATWRFYLETVGITTADLDMDGAQAQLGSVASPYIETNGAPATQFATVELAAQGVRTRFGAATQDLTVTFTTQGVTTRFGAATQALDVTFTTAGDVTTGAEESSELQPKTSARPHDPGRGRALRSRQPRISPLRSPPRALPPNSAPQPRISPPPSRPRARSPSRVPQPRISPSPRRRRDCSRRWARSSCRSRSTAPP